LKFTEAKLPKIEQITSHFYYFMEFLNGGSLYWNLKKKAFNEEEVIFYSAQILCAILFLHSKQIIHQDIKLQNVLLDSNGNAKLCDFNLSSKITTLRPVDYECGTIMYKSPESFAPAVLEYSIDFWSFGVCIFKMFTKSYPFKNKIMIKDPIQKIPNMNEVKVKARRYKLSKFFSQNDRNKISQVACDFISRLLNKNKNERLGNNKVDNSDIKNEPFFASIDWNKLENGQLEPPIKSNLVIIGFLNLIFY